GENKHTSLLPRNGRPGSDLIPTTVLTSAAVSRVHGLTEAVCAVRLGTMRQEQNARNAVIRTPHIVDLHAVTLKRLWETVSGTSISPIPARRQVASSSSRGRRRAFRAGIVMANAGPTRDMP